MRKLSERIAVAWFDTVLWLYMCRFRSCRSQRLPVRLCEHATCVVGDVLYVAGGQQRYNLDGRYTTRDLYAFDLRQCVWSVVSNVYGLIATIRTVVAQWL